MNTTTITFAAALLAAIACQAQEERQGPPEGGHPPHPPMPLIQTLDSDRDHKISAAEIAASGEALKALDENGDGELTLDELLPEPPEGAPPPPHGPAGSPPPLRAGPPPTEGADQEGRPPHRPLPPVIATLDTDRDGKVSASEIQTAPEGLAKLDKNGDGELTPRELQPQGPPHGRGPAQPPQGE